MLKSEIFFKEIFSNKNFTVMTATLTAVHFVENLYLPWWPLYLQELGASVEIIGLIFSIFGLMTFLSTFLGGILADRFGRKKIILLGTALRIIAPLFYLFARTWQQLIPGLTINAFVMVYNPPVYAIILESLPDKRRTTGFGIMQTILILCSSATMVLGGIIMDSFGLIDGVRLILIAIIITLSIVFVIRYKFLSETLKTKKLSEKSSRSSNHIKIRGNVMGMLITSCLYLFSYRMIHSSLVIYATNIMNFTKTEWGIIQMAYHLVWAVTTMPCGIFAERYGKRLAIFLSQVIIAIPLFSYIFLRDFNAVLGVNILAGLGAGFGGTVAGGGPAWQTLIAELVPPEERGKTLGLMGTVTGIISMPSPFLGGYLWENFSPFATIFASAVFQTASIFTFLLLVTESKKARPQASSNQMIQKE